MSGAQRRSGALIALCLLGTIATALPTPESSQSVIAHGNGAGVRQRRLSQSEGVQVLSLLSATNLASSPAMLELASKLHSGTATIDEVVAKIDELNTTLVGDKASRKESFAALETQLGDHVRHINESNQGYRVDLATTESSLQQNEEQRDSVNASLATAQQQLVDSKEALETATDEQRAIIEKNIDGLKDEIAEKTRLVSTLSSMVAVLTKHRSSAAELVKSSDAVLTEASSSLDALRTDHRVAMEARESELGALEQAAVLLQQMAAAQ